MVTGWETIRGLFGTKEEEPTRLEQDVVRVFTLRMRTPDDIVASILPVYGKDGEWHIPDAIPVTTESIWERKDATSKANPGQVLLPGGKILGNGKPESAAAAAVRNLATELHFFGIDPAGVRNVTERTYTFTHPDIDGNGKKARITNRETVVAAEVPPFLVPGYYDPRDKLSDVVRIPYDQLGGFLITERLPWDTERGDPVLLDSLSSDASRKKRTSVVTDGTEGELKHRLADVSEVFEADVVRQTITHLSTIAGTTPFETKADIDMWNEMTDSMTPRKALLVLDRVPHVLSEMESAYSDAPIAFGGMTVTGASARRVRFAEDLRLALQRTYIERSMPFIEHTGPQKPYLLAQILLRFGTWTEYEYGLTAHAPELRHIVSTAAEIFGIETGSPDWWRKLTETMRGYAVAKNKTVEGHATENEALDYDTRHGMFWILFTEKTPGIASMDSRDLDKLGTMANQFAEYLESPMTHIADPATRRQLFFDPQGAGTTQLDELFLRAFGVDQYRATPIPSEEQYAAWRKLILMMQFSAVETLWDNAIRKHAFPMRKAFDTMFPSGMSSAVVIDGVPYARYVSDPNVIAVADHPDLAALGIKPKDYTVTIISEPRDKDMLSLLRKYVERGDLGAETMSDFFGRLITIDDTAFRAELMIRRPDLTLLPAERVDAIVSAWTTNAAATIVEAYRRLLTSWGYAYDRDRIKKAGPVADVLPNGNTSKGSGASNPQWHWLKYVHTASRGGIGGGYFEEELQIFPTMEDFHKKKADDARYRVERLFSASGPSRYPLALVLAGVQKAYEQVVSEVERRRILGGNAISRP